jgi:hypothetical protein
LVGRILLVMTGNEGDEGGGGNERPERWYFRRGGGLEGFSVLQDGALVLQGRMLL